VGSSSENPLHRFSVGQIPQTGPQGQSCLSPRVPHSYNQSNLTNQLPFKLLSGVPNNDFRLQKRELQRNNSIGGITVDSTFPHSNVPLKQRQPNSDLKHQFRPQLSVDKIDDIDVNQIQGTLSDVSFQIDNNDKPKSTFTMNVSNSDKENKYKKLNEKQEMINMDMLINLNDYHLEQKNDSNNIVEKLKDSQIKSSPANLADVKVTDIELPEMNAHELNNLQESSLEKSHEAFSALSIISTIKTEENLQTEGNIKNVLHKESTSIRDFYNGERKVHKTVRSCVNQLSKIPTLSTISVNKNDELMPFKKRMSFAKKGIVKVKKNNLNFTRNRVIEFTKILKKSSFNKSIKAGL
jgi:hypothetical protein